MFHPFQCLNYLMARLFVSKIENNAWFGCMWQRLLLSPATTNSALQWPSRQRLLVKLRPRGYRWEELTTVLREIEERIKVMSANNFSEDTREELLFLADQSRQNILASTTKYQPRWRAARCPDRRLDSEVLAKKISQQPDWLVCQARYFLAYSSGCSLHGPRQRAWGDNLQLRLF